MAGIRSLSEIASRLKDDFSCTPIMATEIEFYLRGATATRTKDQVVELIRAACEAASLPIARAEAEIGKDQFEVSLKTSRDMDLLALQTEHFKRLMRHVFKPLGVEADFGAKPFADQPGSGLHIHVNLQDAAGKNLFTRAGDEMSDPFSDALLQSLGGMLALMNGCMMFFVPTEQSYARFVPKSNAPLTVSWGTNNRTVALRLPSKALDNKHIEHRVAGSDADAAKVMAAVLAGAHYGLTHKSKPGEAIYGDAALPQYKLPPLARSMAEASQHFASQQGLLKNYIA